VFRLQVIDDKRDMTIAIAQVVRFGAGMVDGQLNLKPGVVVAQINQRKIVKLKTFGDVEAKCGLIKLNGSRLLKDADHRVDRFRHRCSSQCSVSGYRVESLDRSQNSRVL